MNLGKALCEIKNPNFHQRKENYKHGISWKPNPNYLVDIFKESVSLNVRGVWHVLWEALSGSRCLIKQQLKLSIIEMFSFCPEISDEFLRITGKNSRLIELIEPIIIKNESTEEFFIRFSVVPERLKELRISRERFLKYISFGTIQYHQVKNTAINVFTFESRIPIKYDSSFKGNIFEFLNKEIKLLNIFTALTRNGIIYSLVLQEKIPLSLSQIMVLYTLLFWLGSLVRYDPHSIEYLKESEYWILIEGFMHQSIIWLLELFEWEFYQWETALHFCR